ncbi:MAG: type II toxin-antitoxin system toxin DNA ADP-ribosyl transferase DarT [Egibacteraceae bacterium]
MGGQPASRKLRGARVASEEQSHQETGKNPLVSFHAIDNLNGIVRAGCLHCDAQVKIGTELLKDVGDPDVKARRRRLPIPVGPGGVPADYVPFYLAPRSPMLYVISKGKVPQYKEGQGPLVYLVTDLGTVQCAGLPYVFSDGNCGSSITEYFTDDGDLDRIDWEIMRAAMWADSPEDGDRMRRRMAELLIHRSVPWDAILGLAVRTESMASRVERVLAELSTKKTVAVKAGWYY